MGLKKKLHIAIDDVADTADEVKHRGAAAEERASRQAAGRSVSTTQRAKSAVREAGHRMAAGADRAKRKIRKKT